MPKNDKEKEPPSTTLPERQPAPHAGVRVTPTDRIRSACMRRRGLLRSPRGGGMCLATP